MKVKSHVTGSFMGGGEAERGHAVQPGGKAVQQTNTFVLSWGDIWVDQSLQQQERRWMGQIANEKQQREILKRKLSWEIFSSHVTL